MARHYITSTAATWLFVLIFVPLVASEGQDSCYSTDNHRYLYFGTKTTYNVVRNPHGIPDVPGCKPLQIWMVGRHGAHWTKPTENTRVINLMDLRDEIIKNHERGSGSLCAEDLSRLRSWRGFSVSSEEEDSLTPQGVRDSYTLGLRVRQALPALFENVDFARDFVFDHTEMHKTTQTAEYFVKGLFGIIFNPKFPQSSASNPLLETCANCPAWSQKNAKAQERLEMLQKSPMMHKVYKNMSKRLGFTYDLPFYAVDAIYQWCVREKTISLDSPAPWCAAFSASDLKAIEFLDDVKYYLMTGSGDKTGMNRKLGCPLVNEMLSRFREIEINPEAQRPKGVFHFVDAETVGVIASRLGLFVDRHPMTTPFVNKVRRHFRTSAILPWNANVMAVFHQCSTGEPYRVMFLVSEYVVTLPGCPSGLCPWSLVRHRLTLSSERRGCPLDFCRRLHYSWMPFTTVELWSIIAVVSTVLFIVHLFRAINKITA